MYLRRNQVWLAASIALFFNPLFALSQEQSIREAPRRLKPAELGVGQRIRDLSFVDLDGGKHKLSDYSQSKATVIAFTGTGCPLCLKYSPTLARLEQEYAGKGIQFVFVNPTLSEKESSLRESIKTHGFKGPYVRDSNENWIRSLQATSTTEVFVLDAARTLVYRGAVDDQYGLGYARQEPRNRYLVDALESLLKGESPRIAATSSPGCELTLTESTTATRPSITYHNRISRIIQNHCLTCHRDGGASPFALASYEQVKDYKGMITSVVKRGTMPPWFTKTTSANSSERAGNTSLHWANDRSLSEQDKKDLLSWIENGTPEGDAKDAPLPKKFSGEWSIGKPDRIFEFPRAIEVQAEGIMPYENVFIDTELKEDRWVQGYEILPGEPAVVHHVLVLVYPPKGRRVLRNGRDDDGINYWAAYVPGNRANVYPLGFARKLPKGSRLRFQMHYTPIGKATRDKTRMGVIWAKEPPEHEVLTENVVNPRFVIGAEKKAEVTASLTLSKDIRVLGYLPHAHLRGVACRYDLFENESDRKPEVLLDVPQYDFNWQLFYEYAEPRLLRKGSKIKYTAVYDNTRDNPANPEPRTPVSWGEQTRDEMHLGYIEYYVPGAKPGEPVDIVADREMPPATAKLRRDALFSRLDPDLDGYLTKQELSKRLRREQVSGLLRQLDKDGDEKISREEFEKFRGIR